ncbi:MAG: helix-turn-helix domain-containing GNAT family N-acetyltransferase, partial [Sneathiella sp.]
SESRIDAIREFNRFYTKQVGALNEGLLKSPFSLTEMRILYELNFGEKLTAGDLVKSLSLDPAYLSRLLKKFKTAGLLHTVRSKTDGRQRVLELTKEGRRVFAPYVKASRDEVAAILAPLSDQVQARLVEAMKVILSILDTEPEKPAPVFIRAHRPGDIGWVIHRHGALYATEYAFDESFEGLVAKVAGDFLQEHDPAYEHCWIAERNGDVLGSVFLMKKDDVTAQLRLLYVEPTARGLGVGRKLVEECVTFARRKRYQTLSLWTNSILHAAIHIYEEAGFKLTDEEPHHSFGQDLVGQNWDLKL